MTQKSRQKLKYLEDEKSLSVEKKHFTSIFQRGYSVVKNCSRLESAPLE